MGKRKSFVLKEKKFPWDNPWLLGSLFFASNLFLSYGGVSPVIKGWIFLGGTIFPLYLGLRSNRKPNGINLLQEETFPPWKSPWLWGGLLGLGIFLRFWKLTSFYEWPQGDEGLNGFFALELASHWDGRFFHTLGDLPPLLFFILGWFFKRVDSPFFNWWFPTAFFSTLTFGLGVWAARLFFSRSSAWILAILFTFSYWPLQSGRFCHEGVLIPSWELTCFILLGYFLKAKDPSHKRIWALLLGLITGLGSFTFTSWVVVAGIIGITMGVYRYRGRRFDRGEFGFFAGAFLLALLPFLVGVFREGYGQHLLGVSAATGWYSFKHQVLTSLSSFTVLLWGPIQTVVSYGPPVGGFLNPLLGACLECGLLTLWKGRPSNLGKWVWLALALSLAPGFLAADYVESFRIIQVMPMVLLVAALGIQFLLKSLVPRWRPLVLILLLTCSCLWDLGRYVEPAIELGSFRMSFRGEVRSPEAKAYQLLDQNFREKGPGLVFCEFRPLGANHTLYVASYHFNASLNPRWDPAQAAWAAILTSPDYMPFLSRRFPGSRWYWVGDDSRGPEKGLMVGLLDIRPSRLSSWGRWVMVQKYFHKLQTEAEDGFNRKESYGQSLRDLSLGSDLVKGDPFLESCFGEWASQYYFSSGYSENALALKGALERGYPVAHLYGLLADYLSISQGEDAVRSLRHKARLLTPQFTLGPEGRIQKWAFPSEAP